MNWSEKFPSAPGVVAGEINASSASVSMPSVPVGAFKWIIGAGLAAMLGFALLDAAQKK